jgi:hypothetical protein
MSDQSAESAIASGFPGRIPYKTRSPVTSPVAVRRALDLNVGDEVIFELDPESGHAYAQVRKAADFLALAGSVPLKP